MRKPHSFVVLQIVGGDIFGFIEQIRYSGIALYDLKFQDELTVRFTVKPSDYGKLKDAAGKYPCEITICDTVGYVWLIRYGLRRKILFLGCILLLLISIFIPTRVFFIQVEGNRIIEEARIIEAAKEAGVRLGTSRRQIRSEKIKNTLLELLPELQWAGITSTGCVAKIAVREKNEKLESQADVTPGRIIAGMDGVVVSCTAVRGNLLCNVGQTVIEGETLISEYMDCGTMIKKVRAEGEVFAQTSRALDLLFPNKWIQEKRLHHKFYNISILLGKKRIKIWKDSGISDVTYDRIYKEYYAYLPGGFRLPVALAVDTCMQWETDLLEIQQESISPWLKSYAEEYLRTQMIAGDIQSRKMTIESQAGILCLTGEYGCTEMIGRVQREEIGAAYEQSD